MNTVGIDFGTSGVRVAGNPDGKICMVPHRFANTKFPFTSECRLTADRSRLSIRSLKRVLDFEQTFNGCSSMSMLERLIGDISTDCMNSDVQNCVVGAPPCFSQRQRSALLTAFSRGGLPNLRVIDDTVAALGWNLPSIPNCARALVYSWGAGSFSAVVYKVNGADCQPIAQEGIRELGGDDLDALVGGEILNRLELLGVDVHRDVAFLDVITEAARDAVQAWSGGQPFTTDLARFTENNEAPGHLMLPHERLVALLDPLVDQTLAATKTAVESSGGKPDIVLTLGGLAGCERVQAALRHELSLRLKPAQPNSVALGLAMYGELILKNTTSNPPRVAEAHQESTNSAERSDNVYPSWSSTFLPMLDAAQRAYEQGQLIDAVGCFEKLFQELTKFGSDLYLKGAAALDGQHRTAEALNLCRRALHWNPSNRRVGIAVSEICYRMAAESRGKHRSGDALQLVDEGIAALEGATVEDNALSLRLAQMRHIKAVCFCDARKLEAAASELRECIRLDPTNDVYAKDLNRLKAIARRPGPNELCPCGSSIKFKKCCGSKKY